MRIWDRNGDEDEDGPQERPNYARKATRALHAFRRTDATRCGSGVDGTARRPQEHGTKGREGAGEEGREGGRSGRGRNAECEPVLEPTMSSISGRNGPP
ncbi:unnamed protein product [Prorocentrum cordatum]|uniref:Uncharacterized protein n=1 Tax=Prorocentrum cordatum TaxID=2364126 RepID=A0ABN9T2G1_9DINO|nr:unnamed protein product [Polarella glacialis]